MPMTVVTLTNVPSSLRGDLTKWMQEISTGVYVGNINTRIRDELWGRIVDHIKQGQATMSYAKRSEIGYDFRLHNTQREVMYYDGIPLIFLPKKETAPQQQFGFSNAAKQQKAKKAKQHKNPASTDYIIVDVETTGLDTDKDQIIEIAALKIENNEMTTFQKLIKIKDKLPRKVSELTGITDDMLTNSGHDIKTALNEFLAFVSNSIVVGYNVSFDVGFLNAELKRNGKSVLANKTLCLLHEVKRKQKLLRDYKLSTVLKKYEIDAEGLHRACMDVKAEYELALKLNIF